MTVTQSPLRTPVDIDSSHTLVADNIIDSDLSDGIDESRLSDGIDESRLSDGIDESRLSDNFAETNLSDNFGEDTSFRGIITNTEASPDTTVNATSTETTRDQINMNYYNGIIEVKAILQLQEWISYAAELWTSPWNTQFLVVTAHWIDEEWKKQSVLVIFSPVLELVSGICS
jgi:hypothetical protein